MAETTLEKWVDLSTLWPLFYFNRYDTFVEAFWRKRKFEKSKNMQMCRERPSWVYNLSEGSYFIGDYWCRNYLCQYCGPIKRDKWATHIRKQLWAEVQQGGHIYVARCRAAEYGQYKLQRCRAGADCYTAHRGIEKYIFANRDFSTRKYANKPAVDCRELYEEDFDDVLCEALRLPEKLEVWPGGNWPPLPPEESPWRNLSYAHLLEREEIEKVITEESSIERIRARLRTLIKERRAEAEPWRRWLD